MNKELLQAVYDCLIYIKKGFQIDISDGICANLIWRIDNKKRFVELNDPSIINKWINTQFKAWPECHVKENGYKDIGFPVGGWDEYAAEVHSETLWENPRRLELLDFLIEQTSKQIKEMN